MKIARVMLIVFLLVPVVSAGPSLGAAVLGTDDYSGESVTYLISPMGRSVYSDQGIVDLEGQKLDLVIFQTKALFFEDTEKIYSDPQTLLPVRIERDIARPIGREYIVEEYDQKKFTMTIIKFKGTREISRQVIKSDGPIHNAILLPFYLRRVKGLKIGWHFVARVPNKFEVELVSIDPITVPGGSFQAYHFKSTPDKFEIWINKDDPYIPLKIQGKGIFDYALLMGGYKPAQKPLK